MFFPSDVGRSGACRHSTLTYLASHCSLAVLCIACLFLHYGSEGLPCRLKPFPLFGIQLFNTDGCHCLWGWNSCVEEVVGALPLLPLALIGPKCLQSCTWMNVWTVAWKVSQMMTKRKENKKPHEQVSLDLLLLSVWNSQRFWMLFLKEVQLPLVVLFHVYLGCQVLSLTRFRHGVAALFLCMLKM